MRKFLKMSILLILIPLSCETKKCDILIQEGIYLIYDERFCEKCRLKALKMADSLVSNEIEYYLISINTISRRKTQIEFRDFAPIEIFYLADNQKGCLKEFPEVSLISNIKNEFKILKDFTN